MTTTPVLVVIGAGGMGVAIARRLGVGRRVVLGDVDAAHLAFLDKELSAEGYDVSVLPVDVTSAASVAEFAAHAAERGPLTSVVHTAGVSPAHASVKQILEVDLLGTALVLDEFGTRVAAQGAGVFIASMAGHLAGPLDADVERQLATTPSTDLLGLPFLAAAAVQDNPAWAYMVAKRANLIRVRTAAGSWGLRGARVNSISPGVIATAMGQAELDGDAGAVVRDLVAGSATGRVGTPEDIAAAVEFLVSPGASFITGTDLLVDGGVVSSVTT